MSALVSLLTASVATTSWGLDRIDASGEIALNGKYTITAQGKGVTAYVIDGGILAEHQDFGGRVKSGPDFSGAIPFRKCENIPSHGTHTAGIIGSKTYGVAKAVTLVDVRVLDCKGKTTRASMEQALLWVAKNAERPAIVNMSVGSPNPEDQVDDAVRAVVAAGIPLIVSAGNEEMDACQHYPSNMAEAIVVGATSDHDVLAPFSNTGKCVTLLAPGWGIVSTMAKHPNASGSFYGTSQAAPFVAGAAALYLEAHPTASPAEIKNALTSSAIPNAIRNANPGLGRNLNDTPDLLLNVKNLLTK